MKGKTWRPKETGKELFTKAEELCKKEGKSGWKLAQRTMLETKPCNRKLREAVEYAMQVYKPDYFRPALLSLICKAVGGEKKRTISTGAGLTLFAWAIGIHDDIIDQSRTKNGVLTILGRFGKDIALILSDVLLFKGFTLLRERVESDMPVDRAARVLETIKRIWFEQSEGEAFEIQHRGSIDVTPEECLEKIRMRASEIEACARIGAILGGGSSREEDRLGRYGRLVGMMGILRNEIIDMLDLRALKHRIRMESLPLPVVYGLQSASNGPRLVQLITAGRFTEKSLREMARLADSSEGIARTARSINKMSREAIAYARSFASEELELLASPFRISPSEWRALAD